MNENACQDFSGPFAGLQIGGDIQFDRLVLGLELSGEYDGASGRQTAVNSASLANSCPNGPGAGKTGLQPPIRANILLRQSGCD